MKITKYVLIAFVAFIVAFMGIEGTEVVDRIYTQEIQSVAADQLTDHGEAYVSLEVNKAARESINIGILLLVVLGEFGCGINVYRWIKKDKVLLEEKLKKSGEKDETS